MVKIHVCRAENYLQNFNWESTLFWSFSAERKCGVNYTFCISGNDR